MLNIFKNISKPIVIFLSLIIFSSHMSFIERRLLGLLQNRYGPNRVGFGGSLQTLADIIKIIFKEDWTPPFSDKTIFIISPIISFSSMLISFSVIPMTLEWVVADFDIGILFFLMVSGLSVHSILLSGWSSNNNYAFLGSIRAAVQTISYELFLGTSILGVVAMTGSFNLKSIVDSQKYIWNIFPQFLGFIIFMIAGIAVCHRHPFDYPESEQELSGGYNIEYSGIKFSLFFIGEYIGIITVSSLITILFFGGWHGPILPPFLWFLLKTFFFIFLFVLIRASLPRPRYDDFMTFGWKICFPLSLINLLMTSFFVLYFR